MSAKDWADIVTASVTAGVVFFGALAATWRFLLQPLGSNWNVTVQSCTLREAAEGWVYVLSISIENRSAFGQRMHGWWRRRVYPLPGFDPDEPPPIYTTAEARDYFQEESSFLTEPYPIAPGETYHDQLLSPAPPQPQDLCYVETAIAYRRWRRRWWLVPYRNVELLTQVHIVVVE